MTELTPQEVLDLHDPLLNPLRVSDADEVYLPATVVSASTTDPEHPQPQPQPHQDKLALFEPHPPKSPPPETSDERSFVQTQVTATITFEDAKGWNPNNVASTADDELFGTPDTTDVPKPAPKAAAPKTQPPSSAARSIALFGTDSVFSEDTDRPPTQDELLFGNNADQETRVAPRVEDSKVAAALKITDDVDEVGAMLSAVSIPSQPKQTTTTEATTTQSSRDQPTAPATNDNLDDDLFAMMGPSSGGAGEDSGFDINAYIAKQKNTSGDDLFS